VADLLEQYALGFIRRHPRQAVPQVQSTLAKISLCRTAALGGRTLECDSCDYRTVIYNSCGDRHCPRCAGAKRANWLDKTEELLLPQVNYFQVVFTLPDTLSSLTLGNRREVYALLMRAAWRALDEVLRAEHGMQPAALLVLHTWNQELDAHPHVHALVPGGGPSADGQRWITTGHRRHRRRKKPYLVDNRLLGEKFQQHFVAGLKRLHRKGEIAFEPPLLIGEEKGVILGRQSFDEWLDGEAAPSWNVFIEGPPKNSSPQQMLKYLTRYLTGGPMADSRLISHEQERITFWARSKNKASGNQPRPFTLSATEFVRRWSLHILPKGFTKTRCYGGFSCRHRGEYLQRCRELLRIAAAEASPAASPPATTAAAEPTVDCPHCPGKLIAVQFTARPSWRDLFRDPAIRPLWYQPNLSLPAAPPAPCPRSRDPAPSQR
jgi:hypothetical protein